MFLSPFWDFVLSLFGKKVVNVGFGFCFQMYIFGIGFVGFLYCKHFVFSLFLCNVCSSVFIFLYFVLPILAKTCKFLLYADLEGEMTNDLEMIILVL